MRLKNFNLKKAKVLHDLVAFKWIKVNVSSKFIHIPDYVTDKLISGGGEGRMGHRYTGEVLAIGPEVTDIKPKDRFLIHEYDKLDQSTPWSEEDIMFCKEGVIPCLLGKKAKIMIQAKQITDKMMNQYEDY